MKSKYLLYSIITSWVLMALMPAQAFDLKILDSNLEVKTKAPDQEPYEILDEVISQDSIKSYIRHDQRTGDIYLSVSARKRSKIRVEWDNKNDVFPAGRDMSDLAFERPGSDVVIRFNVLRPVSGTLKILNEEGKLLKAIPYQVVKERGYRQSLRTSISDSQTQIEGNDNALIVINNSDNRSGSYSLGYSITEKTSNGADPYWSINAGLNSNNGSSNSRSLNASASYSW
ncbi:hypothetical protein [Thiothrix lacustris]|uniref:hypothetical protein n=1 Tax=Thiothrix lacustris TaxID=525917 RepID=UPI0027E548D8|nr:hypothetical protein [Thiothrix lacustris]WMP19238.1 hypothetical protein RCS87_09360 [Thiothrix lacustris]